MLERATDHKCIKEGSYSKRNVDMIKCNGPVNFFLREEVFQATHAVMIKLCKTLPLTGPGGDQLLTPS
jgi:hypothetical protein